MFKAGPMCLSALLVVGCNQPKSSVHYDAGGGQTVTIASPEHGTIHAKIGSSAKLPRDMPAWAPPYPGAIFVIAQTNAGGSSDRAMTNVVLSTTDPLAKVNAYYADRLARAGIKPMQTTASDEASVTVVQTVSGAAGVAIAKNDDDGGSTISINY